MAGKKEIPALKARVRTARALVELTKEQEEKVSKSRALEDGKKDLIRAIEDGEREISNLERAEDEAVKVYVLENGAIKDLLKPSQNLEAKIADLDTMKRILKERFS